MERVGQVETWSVVIYLLIYYGCLLIMASVIVSIEVDADSITEAEIKDEVKLSHYYTYTSHFLHYILYVSYIFHTTVCYFIVIMWSSSMAR